jgi:hypothetical protein
MVKFIAEGRALAIADFSYGIKVFRTRDGKFIRTVGHEKIDENTDGDDMYAQWTDVCPGDDEYIDVTLFLSEGCSDFIGWCPKRARKRHIPCEPHDMTKTVVCAVPRERNARIVSGYNDLAFVCGSPRMSPARSAWVAVVLYTRPRPFLAATGSSK